MCYPSLDVAWRYRSLIDPVWSIQITSPKTFIRHDLLSWYRLCLCWVFWIVSGYIIGIHCCTIYQWSFFLSIPTIVRDSWQILIRVSDGPHVFVITQDGTFQRIWIMNCICQSILCWLGSLLVFLGNNPVYWWYWPISVLGRGFLCLPLGRCSIIEEIFLNPECSVYLVC